AAGEVDVRDVAEVDGAVDVEESVGGKVEGTGSGSGTVGAGGVGGGVERGGVVGYPVRGRAVAHDVDDLGEPLTGGAGGVEEADDGGVCGDGDCAGGGFLGDLGLL